MYMTTDESVSKILKVSLIVAILSVINGAFVMVTYQGLLAKNSEISAFLEGYAIFSKAIFGVAVLVALVEFLRASMIAKHKAQRVDSCNTQI